MQVYGSKSKVNANKGIAKTELVMKRFNIPDKKRGTGIILCLVDKKTYLRENLIALPISYI